MDERDGDKIRLNFTMSLGKLCIPMIKTILKSS